MERGRQEGATVVRDGEDRMFEIGVFLPNAKNGFFRSTHSPSYVPSYKDNLEISLLAEELGFDYIFAMLKWRGFGGATQFWDSSLDSFSLIAALAAATKRVKLIATVSPVLIHPAPMAKMAATVDDVSAGRLGLNIVTGSTMSEYTQMGVLPPGYDADRYAYATEWAQVLKRLWAEERVTHHGRFFTLEDCVSAPKPVSTPHPFLVCAAASDEGLRFTAQNADYCFISGSSVETLVGNALRAKRIAAEERQTIKTAAPVAVVLRDTDADAEEYWRYLEEGADIEATTNQGTVQSNDARHGASKERPALTDRRRITSGLAVYLGGPERVAEGLVDLVRAAELDSLVLLLPDYIDGINRFASGVLPLMRKSLNMAAPAR